MNKDNTHIPQLLVIIYMLFRCQKTKISINLALMWISNGLMPSRKCVILLRLSLEPLSWKGTIMQSLSYIGIFTIWGSGIPIRLISPLLEVDAAMGVGGSIEFKDLFIGSQIWECMEILLSWPTLTIRNVTLPHIWPSSILVNKRQGGRM